MVSVAILVTRIADGAEAMQLTQQQMNHFDTFGFLVFRKIFTPDEMKIYSEEFDAALESRRQQKGGDVKRVWTTLMDSNTPFIASLIDDARFANVAQQVLGGEPIGIVTDGNFYVGDTQWHPDMPPPHGLQHAFHQRYRAAKFTIYLDRVDAANGALRVIPGSHNEPLHSELRGLILGDGTKRGNTTNSLGVRQEEIPAYAFCSEPGDALLFNNAIFHSAFGGGDRRRMGTVIYYADPQTPAATANTQSVMRNNHKNHAREWGDQFYPEYWRSIDDPRHQRWVRRLEDLGILETPEGSG